MFLIRRVNWEGRERGGKRRKGKVHASCGFCVSPVAEVIVRQDTDPVIFIVRPRIASFAGVVEGGIGGGVGVVLASWADETGGERVVVGWGGGVIGVEAASGEGWAGSSAFGVGVGAFWACRAGGHACRSGGRAGCSCSAI